MSSTPDWLLEKILLGEVPPHLSQRAEAARRDPLCQARMQELEAANATEALRHPAPVEAAEILRIAKAQERTEAAHKRMARKRVWGIGIPLATLGLCLAVLPGRLDTTPRSTEANQILPVKAQLPEVGGTSSPNSGTDQAQVTTPPETTPLPNAQGSGSQTGSSVENATVAAVEGIRSKGEEVTLLVHRRTQGKTQRLFQGDTIHPGEMLQLSVQTTRPIHAWILSRDATGEVAVHLPETAAKASAIDSGIHAMPHAWELDNSTGFERFWIVWASGSFEIKELERSVRALPRDAVQLPLPAGLSQRSFTLPKTAP